MRTILRNEENAIFVDCDGVLISSAGQPDARVAGWVRSKFRAGRKLFCWSSRGSKYAASVAAQNGIADCFAAFLPKPALLIDDHPKTWIKYFRAIHPAALK